MVGFRRRVGRRRFGESGRASPGATGARPGRRDARARSWSGAHRRGRDARGRSRRSAARARRTRRAWLTDEASKKSAHARALRSSPLFEPRGEARRGTGGPETSGRRARGSGARTCARTVAARVGVRARGGGGGRRRRRLAIFRGRSPLLKKRGERGVVSADPASVSCRLSAIGKKRRGSRPVDEPFHRSIAPFTRRFAKD